MGILIFLMHLMHIVRRTYMHFEVLMRLYAVLRAAEKDIVYILAQIVLAFHRAT